MPVLAAYAPEPKRLALRLRSALNQSVERGPLVAVYLEVFARKVDDDVLLGFLLHVYVRAHLALKNVITALGFLGAGLILPSHVSDVAARKSLTLTTDGTGFLSLPENAFLPSIERLLIPAFITSGARCAYFCVTFTSLWPRTARTMGSNTPRCTIHEAQVCRRLWKLMRSGSLARRTYFLNKV